MSAEFWETLWLTLQLATITTLILLVVGIPVAYWLAFARFWGKPLVEALVSLPLVLPPTVLGFYLLVGLGPNSWLGQFLNDYFNIRLIFTFPGLVVGSVIYSLPFMVQPVQAGLQHLPKNLAEASYVLGKSKLQTLLRVLLPNIRPALLTGTVLSFAHTVGEFGVILMIGGNIPGKTRVASIALYNEVELLNYQLANQYALVLMIFSLSILTLIYTFNRSR
jgi:molybdate transport system permease protein